MLMQSNISKTINQIDELPKVIEEGFIRGLIFLHKIYELKNTIIISIYCKKNLNIF